MPERPIDDFAHVTLPSQQKRVYRLGLAGNYGVRAADVEYAAERGVNFWLWSPRFKEVTPVLRRLLAQDRDRHVVSVLGNALFPGGPRKDVERALQLLNVDQLDCYKLGWVGRASRFTPGIQRTLVALKDEGKVASLGCSIHDRERAAGLVTESVLDTFMLRYNAKHPGAERDIFPHVGTRNPTIISYTATSWRQLLKPIKGVDMPPFPGATDGPAPPPLTAGHCYRFCLSSPYVHVCLTGPASRDQLDANLRAIEQGPLTAEEDRWIRDYGAAVKRKTPVSSLPFS